MYLDQERRNSGYAAPDISGHDLIPSNSFFIVDTLEIRQFNVKLNGEQQGVCARRANGSLSSPHIKGLG